MVFPSVEEFSKTRFGIQPHLHLPGTVGHEWMSSGALQGEENSQGNFIFDDFEISFRGDG
jgi:hypothetical protein